MVSGQAKPEQGGRHAGQDQSARIVRIPAPASA
jgi:hypothetical protein